jgi:hypothetical protein
MKLTTPLKTWRDQEGREMYRLGDLPIEIQFRLIPDGDIYEVISYPRSSHTGKRQCRSINDNKVQYLNCTKKVYIVS